VENWFSAFIFDEILVNNGGSYVVSKLEILLDIVQQKFDYCFKFGCLFCKSNVIVLIILWLLTFFVFGSWCSCKIFLCHLYLCTFLTSCLILTYCSSGISYILCCQWKVNFVHCGAFFLLQQHLFFLSLLVLLLVVIGWIKFPCCFNVLLSSMQCVALVGVIWDFLLMQHW
jgi:hypothetical protein